MQIWFPEPNALDDSALRRGEDPVQYLARSTRHRARETRRFLNENISMLPAEAQKGTYDALCSRYFSAFFELIVGRTLQTVGATIEVEKQLSSGRRPDFHAHFPDGTIIVEAVSPNFDAPFGEEFKLRNPLTDIVESFVPDGWSVMIAQLPNVGPNDSKREFRARVKRIMATLPPPEPGVDLYLQDKLPTGLIRFRLIPRPRNSPPVLAEGSAAYLSNFEAILEQKFREKRNQIKQKIGESLPALLAVQYIWDDALDDFDSALYGRTTESFDSSGRIISHFRNGGLFAGNSEVEPTFAGILAYRVGYTSVYGPVLYCHPRFNGQFPEALNRLERRQCVDGTDIVSDSADEEWATDLSRSLKFVRKE
ncbi:MAG: hypothetical protein JNK74_06095 [Candidatus Hydrogenedentes bacterium]|nr:hypothetical protein [Candidatus Hydrogenedentota bacterium]